MFREKSLPMVYGGMVFLLSACATAANGGSDDRSSASGVEQYAEDPRLGEEVSRMCFASSVDSFSMPSDDSVVLRVSPSREYLVETQACFDLDHAQSIALDTASGCATRGDRLLVSDSAFGLSGVNGRAPQRCLITGIYEWDRDAEAETAEEADEE